jgi:hypothetical protein
MTKSKSESERAGMRWYHWLGLLWSVPCIYYCLTLLLGGGYILAAQVGHALALALACFVLWRCWPWRERG